MARRFEAAVKYISSKYSRLWHWLGEATDEPHATFFDRLSILILSIEWIVFGSMHFSLPEDTKEMMPEWIPASFVVVIVTGMLEVATGMLILVPKTRRLAALLSLCLLVLFIPAVYHILATKPQILGNDLFDDAFRVLLMPNNIFLAICSVYLSQNPGASLLGPGTVKSETSRPDATSERMATLLVAGLLLMANCAGFLAIMISLDRWGAAFLWAMMCIASGALLGFLFAVPRVNPDVKPSSHLLPNANIEEISDWLTKMLVGVGLVNLKDIAGFIDRRSHDLAISLATNAAQPDDPFALSLIVYFLVVGLIQGYLLTRLFLHRRFLAALRQTS